jgi:MFS family permease
MLVLPLLSPSPLALSHQFEMSAPSSETGATLREQRDTTTFHTLEPTLSPSRPLARLLSGPPAPPHEHPFPGSGTPADPYLVDWAPGERANPYNWAKGYRWAITGVIGISTLCIAFASSAYSTAVGGIVAEFGANNELVVAGLSFYVIGTSPEAALTQASASARSCGRPSPSCTGATSRSTARTPSLWCLTSSARSAPTSRRCSRPASLPGRSARARSPTPAGRSATCSPREGPGEPAGPADGRHERALATSFFSLAPFLGPVIGPIVGGFVAEYRSWRWVFWVQFFFGL